jgi:hypothetical protein
MNNILEYPEEVQPIAAYLGLLVQLSMLFWALLETAEMLLQQ